VQCDSFSVISEYISSLYFNLRQILKKFTLQIWEADLSNPYVY